MKKTEKMTAKKKNCDRNTCLACALCKAIIYEEKRTVPLLSKNETKALYGAEAASYYFYFSPEIKRSQTTTGRQLV